MVKKVVLLKPEGYKYSFIYQFTSGSLCIQNLFSLTISKEKRVLSFKGIIHFTCNAHDRRLKFRESNCQGFACFQSAFHKISKEDGPEDEDIFEIHCTV